MALTTSLVSCSTNFGEEGDKLTPQQHAFQGNQNKPKNIFVFLDGTKNTSNSNSNVWRLYKFVLQNRDPQMTAIYIEGVGSAESAPIAESALGRGMEQKILMGYQFISSNYNPGDNIYIFGFSRGAHQARSLAGLISYAGVPATSIQESDNLIDIGNQIIELVKKKSDEDYADEWKSWQPGQTAILGPEIKGKLGLEVLPAQVRFLGLWDTVPGSSLKDYGVCKENRGVVKKYLYWGVPGTDKGERYKTDSYPAIRRIAHAVSLDEKRSKFVPILICHAIKHEYTQINEVWFPGAHADVGAGYEDSDDLPLISLGWMIQLLDESYKVEPLPQVKGNAFGLAHWSIEDYPANVGSFCLDRRPPSDAKIHPSVDERKKLSPVPVLWREERKDLDYPISCPAP